MGILWTLAIGSYFVLEFEWKIMIPRKQSDQGAQRYLTTTERKVENSRIKSRKKLSKRKKIIR